MTLPAPESARSDTGPGPGAIPVTTVRTDRAKGEQRLPRWLVKTFSPIGLIVLWQVLSSTGVLDDDTLASPGTVAATAWEMWQEGRLQDAVLASVQRVAVGLVFGLVAAVVLATLSGLFRRGEDIADAPMQMLRTVPVIGLIPLLIIWFGIGETPKIVLIALAVTFPLYMNIFGGIRNVDAGLVEAAKTLGLGWFAQVRHVILPAAMPNALVGLRFSLGSAWLALVFGETINATAGIGYEMNMAREFFQTDVIVVCLVLYALLGLVADFLVRLLERTVLAWRPAFRGA
ncbi:MULTISPECIES: ABC transporter permease [unclassified Saccharopolyspora]|uniref:ABC transporter permease n=1 Tax=unclassified Saccharopolyspora TaxID=2646250 RepID=UPI001CD19D63|nr:MULTISPECIES: ABC transporter permease [unclassified Saccharopolyspora]MCA1187150.1 ABC transporter permease [Saccharopolyspora sp. 6T]MCA1193742.1 ABC transporter permease [Saccharopolyspora sp. 6V]MCA1227387.1 ABC transporter permease [Saccharopolyspora sp. 6M]MCA1280418.1 ABC transporter permease [Saccharopolyspora sp. 7B]